eukprot:88053-Prorocentrum_minimum.AAC.2
MRCAGLSCWTTSPSRYALFCAFRRSQTATFQRQDAAGACGRLGLSGGRMDATGARAGQPPDGRRGRLQADHRAVRGPASSSRPTPSAPLVRTPNIAKEQVQPALAGGQSVGDPTLSGLSPWGIRGNKR